MKKKKNYKWVLWSVAGVFALVIGLIIFMLIYVAGHEDNLRSYRRSIENLPEVNQVIEFSRFVGFNEYFVAKVERVDDEKYFYFVKDEIVAHQFPVGEFISEETARNVALNAVEAGRLLNTQLGMHLDDPIYEFQYDTTNGIEYVMVNALTGEIVLHFTLE